MFQQIPDAAPRGSDVPTPCNNVGFKFTNPEAVNSKVQRTPEQSCLCITSPSTYNAQRTDGGLSEIDGHGLHEGVRACHQLELASMAVAY